MDFRYLTAARPLCSARGDGGADFFIFSPQDAPQPPFRGEIVDTIGAKCYNNSICIQIHPLK